MKTNRQVAKYILFSLVFALVAPIEVRAAEADPLAEALRKNGGKLIEILKKKDHKAVGVLKFLVRKGDGPLQDNVGDLNMSLANRTEVALVLANPDESLGILSQASEQVVKKMLTLANHRDEEGRKAFFTSKFPLAWSGDQVQPTGFITGEATLSKEMDKIQVLLQLFDKTGKLEELPVKIEVPLDAKTISEAGGSFALSRPTQKALVTGGPPEKKKLLDEALQQARDVPAPPMTEEPDRVFGPLAGSPVKWTVMYNGKPVAPKYDKLPEPKKDDEISFELYNPGPGTYAVVLLVNGVNSLYHEKAAVESCRKWVLPPDRRVTITGFQTSEGESAKFKVLPPEASDAESVNYGEHAGSFRMVVFAGAISEKPIKEEIVERDDGLAIARTRGSSLPNAKKPQKLATLQDDLRGRYRTGDGSRGLVVKGEKTDKFETTQVQFEAATDIPVADVSLRYYAPKK